jgi:hypothetical protein
MMLHTLACSYYNYYIMIDEQEVKGASDSTSDAPSLTAARTSGRVSKPSKKLREIESSNAAKVPLTKVHFTSKSVPRRVKRSFSIYNDEPTPPPS